MRRLLRALLAVAGLGALACVPNPTYPYDKEVDPRKLNAELALGENGYMVTVTGSVERPGSFLPKAFVTVLEALQLAGGLTPLADRNHIIIQRGGREIPFVYERATAERPEMNLVLLPGDVVQVP